MPNLLELILTPPAGASAHLLDSLPPIRRAFARPTLPIINEQADGYWFRRFAVDRQKDWPAASFRSSDRRATFQLCADPVHLAISGDAVILDATASADLSPEDARSLITHLNAHFAADAMHLSLVSAGEWLLETSRPIDAVTSALPQVHGRSIETHLPQGSEARLLKRIGNEAQMLLHDAAVNLARQGRGQVPINGLWLWGGGQGSGVATPAPALTVYSNAAHVRGIAQAAGAKGRPLPAGATALPFDNAGGKLIIDLDARTGDPHRFTAWLNENWLLPLAQTAARHACEVELTVVLPAATASARMFERDLLRALRRGGLAQSLLRAGHGSIED